jgi:hypothetical protein
VYGTDVIDGHEALVEITVEDDGTYTIASVLLHMDTEQETDSPR